MKKSWFWGLMLLLGCKSQVVEEAPAPALQQQLATVVLPKSTINIPISIPYEDISRRLNQEIGEMLYEDRSYDNNGGDNLQLVVKRTGAMQVQAKGEYMQLKVPLNIYLKGRVSSTLGGLFSSQNAPKIEQDAQFNIQVTASTKAEVQPDWSVRTQSQVSFRWTERPYLEVGVLKIPIGSLVEKVVEQELAKIAQQLDQTAKQQLQFKKQVEVYWKSLFEPMPLPGPVPATLYLQPDSVYMSKLVPDATALKATVGIRSSVMISTLNNAGWVGKARPMPPLQVNQLLPDEVNLQMAAGIDYATASKMARENFVDQAFEFENGDHQLVVRDILLYGAGNTLVAKVKLEGKAKAGWLGKKKINGTYYFKGNPYYDPNSMEIRVRNFDFDVKSRDLLLNSAEWLFKSNFRKQVEEQLRYPIKKELTDLRKLAERSLKEPVVGENLQLEGRIDRLEPGEVVLNNQYILLYLQSSGSVRAQIKP